MQFKAEVKKLDPEGAIRIKYFAIPVANIYHEIFILESSPYEEDSNEIEDDEIEDHGGYFPDIRNKFSSDVSNTIQFVLRDEIISRRALSKVEISLIVRLLNNLNINLLFQNKGPNNSIIIPDIESCLQIQTSSSVNFIRWCSSDYHNYKNELKNVFELAELIDDLLELDYSKLDIPMYL